MFDDNSIQGVFYPEICTNNCTFTAEVKWFSSSSFLLSYLPPPSYPITLVVSCVQSVPWTEGRRVGFSVGTRWIKKINNKTQHFTQPQQHLHHCLNNSVRFHEKLEKGVYFVLFLSENAFRKTTSHFMPMVQCPTESTEDTSSSRPCLQETSPI